MNKNIYHLGAAIVLLLLALNSVSPAQAADVTLQNDGSLFIPHVKEGDKSYSATLKKSDNGGGQLPSFSLEERQPVQKDGPEDATYYRKTGTAEIPSLLIDGVGYTLSLRLQEDNTLTIEQLGLRDQLSLLFMVNAKTASFRAKGTYGDQIVKDHFVIDVDSDILLFSDRPHRVAKGYKGGLTAFAKSYADSDFEEDPPNATFSGQHTITGHEQATVFEMTAPFVYGSEFILPVKTAIGDEVLPPFGSYRNVSFVVDNIFDDIGHAIEHGVEDVVHEAKHLYHDVIDDAEDLYKDVVNGAEKLYEDAKDIVDDAWSIVGKLEGEVWDDAKKYATQLYTIGKNAETGFVDVLKGKDLTSIRKHAAHIISESAHEINEVLSKASVNELFITFAASEQFEAGFGENDAIGFGINLTTIMDDIAQVASGLLSKGDFKLKLSQVEDIVQPFIFQGYTGGVEVGEGAGVAYGLAFNSLSGASVALDVSVALELGVGVSIAMAIPGTHWYDYVEFWHWDLGGVSETLSAGGEDVKLQVAVGVGWTTVITASEFVHAKGGSYAPSFTLTSYLDSNKCLDVSGGQTANDTNIDLYDCNGTRSQKWFWKGSTIRSGLDQSKCLDVWHAGTANDTNIDLYDCNGTNSQVWTWDGATLTSGLDSNKCLDVSGGQTGNNTNIDLYDCNETNSQNWDCNPESGASCNPN